MISLTDDGEPTKFIREIKEKANILVVYEDTEYSRSLELLFLKMGLQEGRIGLYLSSENAHVMERHVSMSGIDPAFTRSYERLQVASTSGKKMEMTASMIENFVENAKKRNMPARIIMRNDEFSEEQFHDLIQLESRMMSLFEQSEISVLSSYNAEFLSDANIMQRIISMHDYVVFAPTFGKGMVVKTK